jgi:DNA-binding transcriptional MerR regulator
MTVNQLLKAFRDHKKPHVAASAYLGIHPQTIRVWEKKDGKVPSNWEALYKSKKENEK